MTRLLPQASLLMAEQFIQPLVMLIAISFLIQSLGAGQFGLFSIALTITAMSPVLGLGGSALIVREIAHRLGASGLNGVSEPLRHAFTILLAMSAMTGIGMVIFSPLLIWLLSPGEADQSNFLSVLGIGLACAIAQELDTLFSGVLKGLSHFAWSAGIEICGRLVWLIAVVIGAQSGELEVVLLASLTSLVIKACVKGWICMRLISTPFVLLPSLDFVGIRELLQRSIWLWIQGLGGILFSSVDRLVVGKLFGSSAMGGYVACAQLTAFALMLPAAAGQVLVPWFLKHSASNSVPRQGWHIPLWGFAVASAVPGVLIAISGKFVLSVWLGGAFADIYWPVLFALAISAAAVAIAVPFHFGLLAAGVTRVIAFANISGGLLSIFICIGLAKYGLTAFSFGKLIYAIPLVVLPCFLFRYLRVTAPVHR